MHYIIVVVEKFPLYVLVFLIAIKVCYTEREEAFTKNETIILTYPYKIFTTIINNSQKQQTNRLEKTTTKTATSLNLIHLSEKNTNNIESSSSLASSNFLSEANFTSTTKSSGGRFFSQIINSNNKSKLSGSVLSNRNKNIDLNNTFSSSTNRLRNLVQFMLRNKKENNQLSNFSNTKMNDLIIKESPIDLYLSNVFNTSISSLNDNNITTKADITFYSTPPISTTSLLTKIFTTLITSSSSTLSKSNNTNHDDVNNFTASISKFRDDEIKISDSDDLNNISPKIISLHGKNFSVFNVTDVNLSPFQGFNYTGN
jgi:hypothetical protein